MSTTADLVTELGHIQLPDLFNPYTDHDPLHDLPDAPARRRQNLQLYLEQLLLLRPTTLWLAESGSHTGTRRSGLPLIPTTVVTSLNQHFSVSGFTSPTKTDDQSGMTASYVWTAALVQPQLPLLWNAVMAHPHRPGQPYRNRSVRQTELCAYLPVLLQLIDCFELQAFVAIGRPAERMLREAALPYRYVRHPAQGGAAAFRAGIRE